MEERARSQPGSIAPPRVFVLLVVGQRGVLDQGEEEGGLRVRVGETGLGAWVPNPARPVYLQPPSTDCSKSIRLGEVFPRRLLCLCRLPAPLGVSTRGWPSGGTWCPAVGTWSAGWSLHPLACHQHSGCSGRCGPRKSQSSGAWELRPRLKPGCLGLSPNPRPPSGSSELLNLRGFSFT